MGSRRVDPRLRHGLPRRLGRHGVAARAPEPARDLGRDRAVDRRGVRALSLLARARRRVPRRPLRPPEDLRSRRRRVRRGVPRMRSGPRRGGAHRALAASRGSARPCSSRPASRCSAPPFRRASGARPSGTWSALTSLGSAIGPALGGWLVQAISWRAVFLINLPIAAVLLWITLRKVPETRNPQAGRLDVAGALLATAGLGALVLRPHRGADPRMGRSRASGAASRAGVAGLAAFVAVERRTRHPMVPLSLFRNRTFTAANLLTLFLYAALAALFFFLPFVLIQARGLLARRVRRGPPPADRPRLRRLACRGRLRRPRRSAFAADARPRDRRRGLRPLRGPAGRRRLRRLDASRSRRPRHRHGHHRRSPDRRRPERRRPRRPGRRVGHQQRGRPRRGSARDRGLRHRGGGRVPARARSAPRRRRVARLGGDPSPPRARALQNGRAAASAPGGRAREARRRRCRRRAPSEASFRYVSGICAALGAAAAACGAGVAKGVAAGRAKSGARACGATSGARA